MTMKSEIRNPILLRQKHYGGQEAERNPNTEFRSSDFGFSHSSFFRHSSFVIRHSRRAFTLIELLVVIAIMAILAALIFPVTAAVNKAKIRSRARSEMNQVITGIENYKAKLGHYPPDNAPTWDVNQLYYELMGTTMDASGTCKTLDGVTTITTNQITAAFPGVSGFVNSTKGSGGDEAAGASKFLVGLKSTQILAITVPRICTILGASVDTTNITAAGTQKINPWNYNSSSPTNNPRSFDLWIDIPIGGKINRICNWSDKPILY